MVRPCLIVSSLLGGLGLKPLRVTFQDGGTRDFQTQELVKLNHLVLAL